MSPSFSRVLMHLSRCCSSPCMIKGETLKVIPPVSPRLLYSLSLAQSIFTHWYPHFQRIEIEASARVNDRPEKPGNVLSFFSAGVDAFYSLLKSVKNKPPHIPSVSHLVHMRGIESALKAQTDLRESRLKIAEVADAFQKDCIFGETNFRNYFTASWGPYYCGAGLASVGLSLSAGFGHVLIPSSDSISYLPPWGSHPLLDPLWSTERTEIIYDGCEITRAEKIATLVGRNPMALKYLRVCTGDAGSLGRNCGRCSKCIRTMISLQAINTLSQSNTFPNSLPPDYESIIHDESYDDDNFSFVEGNLALCKQVGADPQLVKCLERTVRKGRRRKSLMPILDLIEHSPLCFGLRFLRFVHKLMRKAMAH